jgi:uncharacterized protein YacL
MEELLSNDYFVLCIMSIIICLITQLIKMPIKIFTNKIKDQTIEKRVTALFMLIPLVLGVVINFFYNVYYLHVAFSIVTGLSWGTTSIMFYQGFRRFITGKETTAEEMAQFSSVKDLVDNIVNDGKVDKNDASAVNEFLNKVK